MEIQYIKNNQIDKSKWDLSIDKSQNGLVYAQSWFLDIIAPGWDALISGDYEIIMPLPQKTVLGQWILFQPVFAHQLGIFSSYKLTNKEIDLFIHELIKHFGLIDIKLNNQNPASNNKLFYKRNTQLLNLDNNYNDIEALYNRSTKNNLKKSKREKLDFDVIMDSSGLVELVKEMYKRKNVKGVGQKEYDNLKILADFAIEKGIGKIYAAFFGQKICSAMLTIQWKGRIYTFYGTNELGRQKRAMFALLDHFISLNSGMGMVLDFCGSNILGVMEWNMGFGAQNHTYSGLYFNNLPFWLKWRYKN